MRILPFFGMATAFTFSAVLPAAAESETNHPASGIETATRLQVFLDRADFGPGKIDGRYGGFTEKALHLYRESHGLPAITASTPSAKLVAADNAKEKQPTTPKDGMVPDNGPKSDGNRTHPLPKLDDMDLASVGSTFVDYQITEADQKQVGKMPDKVAEMAEQKWLPYASLGEMVAEKFHCDLDFLKELNPQKIDSLKPGDVVKVPNVEPFDLSAVKELPLLDQLAMNREDADAKDDTTEKENEKPKGSKSRSEGQLSTSKAGEDYQPSDKTAEKTPPLVAAEDIPAPSDLKVEVSTTDNMLRLLEHGKLVAAYPVTIGSEETKSPQGDWKVRGIARLPDFRYDSSFLNTGKRGDKTYLLPPGPNNLVGVVWVALNRRGIGLHGTGEPDSIGRSASHGCVRLANWDIVRLATKLRAGAQVSIH